MTDDTASFKIVPERAVPSPPADPAKFTEDVWQANILARVRPDGLTGSRFVYGPGARSNWHVHTGEQAIVVVAGRGLVQWDGLDAPQVLEPGDWLHVQPHIAHWHGAAPDSAFVHLSITATGETLWAEPVTDEQYRRTPSRRAVTDGP